MQTLELDVMAGTDIKTACKDGSKTWYSIRHENDRDLAASVKKMTRPTAKKRISVNDV